MRCLTLGYLTFADLSPLDLIEVAARAGFRSVGLRLTGRYKTDRHVAVLGHAAAVAELRRRLRVHGMRLSNISAYYLTPDITIADLEPIVDLAAELEATLIIANRHDPHEERYLDLMRAYCEKAQAAGLRLAVEVMRYSETKSLSQGLAAIASVGADNFGLVADALHLARAGDSPAALRAAPAERIFLAQLCDAKNPAPATLEGLIAEARGGRFNPGEGDLPLYDFLDALPDDIEIECEVPRADASGHAPLARAHEIQAACRSYLERYRLARRPAFTFD